jgi:hypothetical protein
MAENDLSDALAAGAVAYFGLKGLDRLLGPTLDFYGEGLRGLAAAGNRNLISIFRKAIKKLGRDIENDDIVSPRLFKQVIDQAPYCEDVIVQEYLAGILASSRTMSGTDAFVHHAALINRLSALQIRLHYIIYALFYYCYKSGTLRISADADRRKMGVVIAFPIIAALVKDTIGGSDQMNVEEILSYHNDAVENLRAEDLLGLHVYGSSNELSGFHAGALIFGAGGGLFVTPSARGAELFLRANGIRHRILRQFFEVEFDYFLTDWLTIEENCNNEIIDYEIGIRSKIEDSPGCVKNSSKIRIPREDVEKLAASVIDARPFP